MRASLTATWAAKYLIHIGALFVECRRLHGGRLGDGSMLHVAARTGIAIVVAGMET